MKLNNNTQSLALNHVWGLYLKHEQKTYIKSYIHHYSLACYITNYLGRMTGAASTSSVESVAFFTTDSTSYLDSSTYVGVLLTLFIVVTTGVGIQSNHILFSFCFSPVLDLFFLFFQKFSLFKCSTCTK